MKNEYLVDIKILENNGKTNGGLIIIDKLKSITVKDAIELLTTKYESKKEKNKNYDLIDEQVKKILNQ